MQRTACVSGWVIVTVWTGLCAEAADWAQFRGPGGQGIAAAAALPTEWSDHQNLAWKVPLPGYGSSSPIVWDGRVFVTCYSGYGLDRENPGKMDDLRLHVVCLNLADGTSRWTETIEPKLPEEKQVRDHGYAAATPVTDGERLYVFFGKTGVIALDLEGNLLWQTSVGSQTHGWGSGTSPVLYQDLVIVNASVESGKLVALNKATGEIVWQAEGMDSSWNTPHLVSLPQGGVELVVSVQNRLLGFDPATGKQLWSCDAIEDYVCPSVVSQDGIVYVIGGRQSKALAVRAGGRGDVTETHKLWQAQAGANVSSPVIDGDYLYWVSDRNQVAYCLNRHTGEIVYSERMRGQPYASAVLADGKLYVVTRYDGTFVLAAKPEFELLAQNRLEDDSMYNASPAVAGNALLIRSDRHLFCIRR
jgi:outer membrane protein assembly factor BamB